MEQWKTSPSSEPWAAYCFTQKSNCRRICGQESNLGTTVSCPLSRRDRRYRTVNKTVLMLTLSMTTVTFSVYIHLNYTAFSEFSVVSRWVKNFFWHNRVLEAPNPLVTPLHAWLWCGERLAIVSCLDSDSYTTQPYVTPLLRQQYVIPGHTHTSRSRSRSRPATSAVYSAARKRWWYTTAALLKSIVYQIHKNSKISFHFNIICQHGCARQCCQGHMAVSYGKSLNSVFRRNQTPLHTTTKIG